MGTPSTAEDFYDLVYRLLEEGRPPDAAAPPPEPRRRSPTPAWARAIRGFSNATGLAVLVLVVAPMAARCASREEAFMCAFLLVMAAAFPVLGYVFTVDLPEQT